MVKLIFHQLRGMGMEVCTTLGMLSPEQARQLKEAGLTAYNHNLDTSREFYPKVSHQPRMPLIYLIIMIGDHNTLVR